MCQTHRAVDHGTTGRADRSPVVAAAAEAMHFSPEKAAEIRGAVAMLASNESNLSKGMLHRGKRKNFDEGALRQLAPMVGLKDIPADQKAVFGLRSEVSSKIRTALSGSGMKPEEIEAILPDLLRQKN
jgi:hypothetical protein